MIIVQKLILPVNKCKLTASWKTATYYNRFGFPHYGVDMVSTAGKTYIYSSGIGEVVALGRDNVVGNVVVVKYYDALHRPSGRSWDVVFRYFHLSAIHVKVGQRVDTNTLLGYYGNTGLLPMAPHLHLEADADTKYLLYSPTVKSSNLVKGTVSGANDKTMYNPLDWLHRKVSLPENQTYVTTQDAFIRELDKIILQIH